MSPLTWHLSNLALLVASSVVHVHADGTGENSCVSYGMDFQQGGSYFQNINSSDPFTCVTQFEGCQSDVADNVLVDPNGDQHQCTDTNLTPDDTDQMSTCPLKKSQLWSGDWSFIIISNNGDAGEPIAYQRDFYLSVGEQSTSTITPTVTIPLTSTPVINSTTTSTETSTTTLVPVTVTKASATIKPTTTITPAPVTTTTTKTLIDLTLTKFTPTIVITTKTKTASCRLPTRQSTPDPTAKITPTVNGLIAAALATPQAVGYRFRRLSDRRKPIPDLGAFLRERRDGLAQLAERAPDPQPLVVTDTDTANWVTSTVTSTAAAVTVTVVVTTTKTSTATPAPVTVVSGRTTAAVVTVTATPVTRSKTAHVIGTVWTTKTISISVTLTTVAYPTGSTKTACLTAGGVLLF